jgi:hypothetical protein
MQWIPVTAQRADRQSTLIHGSAQGAGVAEQCIRIAVRAAGIVARPKFDGVEAELDDAVERLLQREIREEDGEDADLYAATPAKSGMISSPYAWSVASWPWVIR